MCLQYCNICNNGQDCVNPQPSRSGKSEDPHEGQREALIDDVGWFCPCVLAARADKYCTSPQLEDIPPEEMHPCKECDERANGDDEVMWLRSPEQRYDNPTPELTDRQREAFDQARDLTQSKRDEFWHKANDAYDRYLSGMPFETAPLAAMNVMTVITSDGSFLGVKKKDNSANASGVVGVNSFPLFRPATADTGPSAERRASMKRASSRNNSPERESKRMETNWTSSDQTSEPQIRFDDTETHVREDFL